MKQHGERGGMASIGEVIHKERSKEKYNKTTGQYDKLKKYSNAGNSSSGKLATDDKQIAREAKYMKNIHIDDSYSKLVQMGLITNEGYQAWWCGVMHKLGVAYVMAQADLCLKNGRNPAALFHFQINKAINKATDPYMPRFNR